jgi:energy-coupling factor transporter ATP-binding protein EcfA2
MQTVQPSTFLITRIRLVNFHNFIDETIDLPDGGHLFLLGDNGCGKTTILDAIHYVLTAGQEMEWNAAARVAGSRREGRRVQGIVMRFNIDRGIMNPEGGVSYALLEIRGRNGNPLTVGIGLSVSAIDEKVRQWGIIRECPLAEIPLLVEEEDGVRPAGRLEFKEAMGAARGFYKDGAAYRRELAVRLFADQESYREICRFLAMGKAYRELASQASDYHELFKSLLPEPKTEIFERIIEALRGLDESKTVLDDLEGKLDYLHMLQRFIDTIGDNREAVVRYDWLEHHQQVLDTEDRIDAFRRQVEDSRDQMATLEGKIRLESEEEAAFTTQLDDLKAKDVQGLVRQEKEVRAQLTTKETVLAGRKKEYEQADKEEKVAGKAFLNLEGELRRNLVNLHRDLARISPNLAFSISDLLTELDGLHRSENSAEEAHRLNSSEVFRAASGHRDDAVGSTALLEQRQRQLATDIEIGGQDLEHLQKTGEAAPQVAGFSPCLRAMRDKLLSPKPLYLDLEWRPGLERREMSHIEEFIGEEVLATLRLADPEFEVGREVAAAYPGLRVTCNRRGMAELPEWIRMAFDLQHSDPFALRCLSAEMVSERGPVVAEIAGKGILSFRSHDRCLAGVPSRWIGESSRREAIQAEIRETEKRLQELIKEQKMLERQEKEARQKVELLKKFTATLQTGVHSIRQSATDTLEARQKVRHLAEMRDLRGQQFEDQQRETRLLAERLRQLESLIKQEGLTDLERSIERLATKLAKKKEEIKKLNIKVGEEKAGRQKCEKDIADLITRQERALTARQESERRLSELLSDIDDLPHYILRTKKGFQFKTIESVQKEREQAVKTITENRSILKERLNNPEFGGSFRFTYEEQDNLLVDYRSRHLAEILRQQGEEIAEQKEIINERTKELFRKIIMTELVNYLRTHVDDLERMMRRIGKLLNRRVFGGQQYRFRITPRENFQRLVAVIKKFSPFDPAAEEALRHFFEDRKEAIVNTEVGAIPEELDYRNWYRYEMEVTTQGEEGVVIDRRTKSMGSGGEQAVPNYLLVLTIAHFVYQGKKIRLHTLLFDEAFYGIDAGRRDQLLGFATDLNLQLMVASPDQDGVRREVGYSTTLLVKKDLNNDVHLYPYHWQNPGNVRQIGLFDVPAELQPIAFGEEL